MEQYQRMLACDVPLPTRDFVSPCGPNGENAQSPACRRESDAFLECMLKACEEMKKGGWWEAPKVNVKSAVSKEFVVAIAKSLVGI